jgi:hypothetical protein
MLKQKNIAVVVNNKKVASKAGHYYIKNLL